MFCVCLTHRVTQAGSASWCRGAAPRRVGLALGGVDLNLQSRTDKRLDGFGGELRTVGRRVARLEGLIEGSGLFRIAEPSNAAGD